MTLPPHILNDLLVAVDLVELDLDDLAAGGRDGAAGEGRLDGELTVATVDEDEELDAAGASVAEEGVECGADGATGVEDVVAEDDVAASDVEAQLPGDDGRARACSREIVAVEADVENTGVDGVLLNLGDEGCEALRKGDAAALDADEAKIFAAVVLLDDLVGQADEGSFDLGGRHEAALLAELRGLGRDGLTHSVWA